jgi:hypothetical protein
MEHNPFLGFHLPKDLNSKYFQSYQISHFQSVHKCLIAFNNSKKGMLIVQALVLFEAVNAVCIPVSQIRL